MERPEDSASAEVDGKGDTLALLRVSTVELEPSEVEEINVGLAVTCGASDVVKLWDSKVDEGLTSEVPVGDSKVDVENSRVLDAGNSLNSELKTVLVGTLEEADCNVVDSSTIDDVDSSVLEGGKLLAFGLVIETVGTPVGISD